MPLLAIEQHFFRRYVNSIGKDLNLALVNNSVNSSVRKCHYKTGKTMGSIFAY